MTQQDGRAKFKILYVDDEAQALKYFRKALEKDFEILTATSVAEGAKLVEEHGAEIGVLVSDQRMPGERGTDLLTQMRRDHPGVIRILTTAYSDLDSAIEAVNSGAIYKYIVKPWDLRDLRVTLLRAMDHFELQRQRDQLMREKLSVLQRMLVIDRVRSLAVLAAGLSHHIRNSMSALKAFLDHVPSKLRDEIQSDAPRNEQFWNDLWHHAQSSSRDIFNMIDRIASNVVHPSAEFNDSVNAKELLEGVIEHAGQDGALQACTVNVSTEGEAQNVRLDKQLAARMLRSVLEHAATVNDGKGVLSVAITEGQTVGGAPGVRVLFKGDGAGWNTLKSEALFAPLDPGSSPKGPGQNTVLSAFFIAYHHGGEIHIGGNPEGAWLELLLPYDPQASKSASADPAIFDHVFSVFDLDADPI